MTDSSQPPRRCFAALLTPRGRGAVATVRFEGHCSALDQSPIPLFRAANGKPVAKQPPNRIVFGRWGHEAAEDVVVCRTAETVVEIHCHGGDAAARRILLDLESAGCCIESWFEMLVRTQGLFEAELAAAASNCATERTALLMLEQQSGILKAEICGLRDACLADDDATIAATVIGPRLHALLAWAEFGLHLTAPWQVVLTGRPNVGKSSLINRLVGYSRSIVFDQPGTTRDVVTAQTAFDGWPVQLADTAGIRDSATDLEASGIERARASLADADCVVVVLDTSAPPDGEDRRLLAEFPQALIVAHKSDLPDMWGDSVPDGAIRASSVTGAGIEAIMREFVERLVPQTPNSQTPIPVTSRQIELLREARNMVERRDFPAAAQLLEDVVAS